MANAASITLQQLFRYYRNEPHQAAAISLLEQDLASNGYAAAMRRDRPWFEAWSQDGKQSDLSAAINLIKEFEGVRLSAYPDPASGGAPWTIGYGTTCYSGGIPVKQGDKITIVEADMMLRLEVDRIAAKLRSTIPFWQAMTDGQRSALVSFAYNLGADFYGASGFETISKVLKDKDWAAVPAVFELYRNPGSNVEAGLLRRRKAEAAIWGSQQQAMKLTPASSFSARLTPHITIGEFALNEETRRFKYPFQLETAAELASFLEKCRTHFGGKPVIITSGYRPPEINRSIGGATKSEHLYASKDCGAVDFYIEGVSVQAVQDWCDENWPYSVGYGAPKGFVHLGIRPGRPRVRWDY